MAWGWGATLGGGALLIAGFFTGGLTWAAAVPLLAGGAAAGAGGAALISKAVSYFGSTPANDLQQIPGMEGRLKKAADVHKEAKKYRKDKLKYKKEVLSKDRTDLDALNRKVEELKEDKIAVSKEIQEAKDNGDGVRVKVLTAKLDNLDSKLASYLGQAAKKEATIKESEDKIDDIYDKLGDPDTMNDAQYVSNANSINWASVRSWGVVFLCIIVGAIVVALVRKFVSSLTKMY